MLAARDSKQTPLSIGMTIPLFEKGWGAPRIASASDMNVLVRVLQAVVRMKIVRGEMDQVLFSDGNLLVQVATSPEGLHV